MEKLTVFYMQGCPYCQMGKRSAETLLKEDRYRALPVEWVDEQRDEDRAARYDYYYVPSIFLGDRKLFEAHPGDTQDRMNEAFREAFEQAVQA